MKTVVGASIVFFGVVFAYLLFFCVAMLITFSVATLTGWLMTPAQAFMIEAVIWVVSLVGYFILRNFVDFD
jgi:hypothetical protein